jgi:drug/metabolite transporter (DMT)-like permease
MATAFLGFLLIALALGQLAVPRGWTVWGALIVTGVFASALGYLIQVWTQRRISATRIALVFSLETVWAGFFGYLLADDRLGLLGWGGCALSWPESSWPSRLRPTCCALRRRPKARP